MKADEFRKLLKEAKMKQSDLAKVTGYTPRQINNFAVGANEIPKAVIIVVSVFAFVENLKKLYEDENVNS